MKQGISGNHILSIIDNFAVLFSVIVFISSFIFFKKWHKIADGYFESFS